jgi:hypothetical protein
MPAGTTMTAICKQLYACYKGINGLQQSQARETAEQRAARLGGAAATGPGAGRAAGGVAGVSANAETVMVRAGARRGGGGRQPAWGASAACEASGMREKQPARVSQPLTRLLPSSSPQPSQPRCLSALGYGNKEIIAAP